MYIDLNLPVERSYPNLLSNSTLLPLLLLSLARQKNTPDPSTAIKNEYDFIVVGAGSAGSVVASRLSEIPCVSVLLLEAGGPPPRINDVPAIGAQFWFTDLDWQYETAPQKYTGSGLNNRKVTWPSGKGLGGSSLLNNGLHVRGNRKDYDDWEAMGAKGWSYEEVLPYFLKMEDNRDPEYLANGYHRRGGPVTVMKPKYNGPIKGPILQAAQSMGYRVVDPNAQRQTGFYDLQGNFRDSQRCSTAKAYLVPAENRTNLDILSYAFVKKVVIKNRRATGVIFSSGGRNYEVQAKREVIVSAGAIKTAQLLMLSGIGPKEELQKFNIAVHVDLPVGQNLQDHASSSVFFVMDPSIKTFPEKVTNPRNIKRYIYNRTGPLSSAEAVSVMAFLYNDEINPKIDYPNYELYFAESTTDLPRTYWNLKPQVFEQVYGPYRNEPLILCFVQQLHPRSRGTVTLHSASPYDEPIIDPNYLEDPQDIEDFVQGMKTCSRILSSRFLRKVGARPLDTLHPGCENFAHDEDQYFRCQVQSVLFTLSHPSGTAKMGDPRDHTTVVDPKLRVKNIKGLRVVDNSIMPKLVSGNTGVPAIMIGEKAADIIKETIKCHRQSHPDPDYNIQKHLRPSNMKSEDLDYDHHEDSIRKENIAQYAYPISPFDYSYKKFLDKSHLAISDKENHKHLHPMYNNQTLHEINKKPNNRHYDLYNNYNKIDLNKIILTPAQTENNMYSPSKYVHPLSVNSNNLNFNNFPYTVKSSDHLNLYSGDKFSDTRGIVNNNKEMYGADQEKMIDFIGNEDLYNNKDIKQNQFGYSEISKNVNSGNLEHSYPIATQNKNMFYDYKNSFLPTSSVIDSTFQTSGNPSISFTQNDYDINRNFANPPDFRNVIELQDTGELREDGAFPRTATNLDFNNDTIRALYTRLRNEVRQRELNER